MHFLSLVDASLGRCEISDLALARAYLVGVGCLGGFFSNKSLNVSITVSICPLAWFFWFYKVRYPTHWPFVKISRARLRSWGFPFNSLCLTFPEKAQKLSLNLMIISTWAGLPGPNYFLRNILYCCLVAFFLCCFLTEFFWAYHNFSFFPVKNGLRSSQKGWFATARSVLGSLLPDFRFLLFYYKEVLNSASSILSNCISFFRISSFLCRGGQN